MLNLYTRLGHLGLSLSAQNLGGANCVRHARMVARRPVRVHIPVQDEKKTTMEQYEEILVKKKPTKKKEPGVTSHRNEGVTSGSHHSEEPDIVLPHEDRSTGKQSAGPDLMKKIQHQNLSDAKVPIRSLLNNASSRKYREAKGLFVAEGVRIIKEALEAGAHPKAIFFTRLSQLLRLSDNPDNFGLEDLLLLNALPFYRAPYKTLQTWSTLTTAPGIVGVFSIPEEKRSSHVESRIPVVVVLDEVREPSNMAGILRTAAAVGIHRVILMKGCCDPWETKVVRGGCGAHFRLQMTQKATWDSLTNLVPEDAQLLVADMCRNQDLDADEKESENDSHIRKVKNKRSKSKLVDQEEHGHVIYELDSEGNRVVIDASYNNEVHLRQFKDVQLPVRFYDSMIHNSSTTGKSEAVVIIGGETGLTNAAKKFASIHNGLQVAIPLANGMDSLNSSVAAGIILYELNRQYQQESIKI